MNVVWEELHQALEPLSNKTDSPTQCSPYEAHHQECDSIQQTPRKGTRNVRPSYRHGQSLQVAPRTPPEIKDLVIFMQSTKLYNEEIVPTMRPAHLPFKRQKIDTQYWHLLPGVMQHLWIVTVYALQGSKSGLDPSSNQTLCYYRGRSLKELHELLSNPSEAATDPYGVALFSILFLMAAEMQLSESHWSTHLEAARRIITLRGGMEQCFMTFCTSRVPLLSYMVTDIMTATTCNSRSLDASFVHDQEVYLRLLPDREQDLVACSHPCPEPLLEAIVQINILRTFGSRNSVDHDSKHHQNINFFTILAKIEAFDAERWTARVATFGRRRPERASDSVSVASLICLTSLATCFKSAALLYLFFSHPVELLSHKSAQMRQTVHLAKHTLTQHVQLLLSKASKNDDDGPLHTQLWKFIVWPLLVSAYVHAGWNEQNNGMDANLGNIRAMAARMGSKRLLNIEKFVERVQQMRAAEPPRKVWKWDDGFSARSAFIF